MVVSGNKQKLSFLKKFYYATGTLFQRVDQTVYTGPLILRSIDQSPTQFLDDVYNVGGHPWTTTPWFFTPVFFGPSYIGYLEFYEDNIADGDDDGQLTLGEALNAVWNEYQAMGKIMPTSVIVDYNENGNSAIVYVVKSATPHV